MPADFWSRIRRKLSPTEALVRLRAGQPTRDIVAGIDQDAFFALRRGARARAATPADLKYFNLDDWMREAVVRALRLDLRRARDLRILDVGAGFGFFPYACEYLSHKVMCTDVPGVPLYDEATAVLGLNRMHHAVERFEPLPDFGRRFDLVTCFQVAFDLTNDDDEWDEEEWRFFVEDVRANVLAPGGRLYMELNYKPRFRDWMSPATKAVLRSFGARIDANRVDIRAV